LPLKPFEKTRVCGGGNSWLNVRDEILLRGYKASILQKSKIGVCIAKHFLIFAFAFALANFTGILGMDSAFQKHFEREKSKI